MNEFPFFLSILLRSFHHFLHLSLSSLLSCTTQTTLLSVWVCRHIKSLKMLFESSPWHITKRSRRIENRKIKTRRPVAIVAIVNTSPNTTATVCYGLSIVFTLKTLLNWTWKSDRLAFLISTNFRNDFIACVNMLSMCPGLFFYWCFCVCLCLYRIQMNSEMPVKLEIKSP